MRYNDFFIRTGFFLPVVIFAVFVFMMVFGIVSSVCGAGEAFYCSVYCKIGISLLITALAAVVLCQARACWKR
jgi:hypothetical protein